MIEYLFCYEYNAEHGRNECGGDENNHMRWIEIVDSFWNVHQSVVHLEKCAQTLFADIFQWVIKFRIFLKFEKKNWFLPD